METLLVILQLVVVLGCLLIGTHYGGIGLGLISGIGLFLLVLGPLKVWLTSGVYAASLAVGFMMSSNSTGVSFPSLR